MKKTQKAAWRPSQAAFHSEDEMMLRDSAEAEYELDRADFDTLGRFTRNRTASYSV